MLKTNKRLNGIRHVRQRYQKSDVTIWRWTHDPDVNFPKPDVTINGQRYWYDETLDRFDEAHASESEDLAA